VTVTRSIRVLIADDHPPTRAEVRRTLEREPDFGVCAEAADAAQAIESAMRERPDICLLDIRMPGRGTAAAWEISARLPQTRIVMLTVSRDDDDLFAALRAGAVGYLLKDLDPPLLAPALRDVLEGEAVLPGSLAARLVAEFRDRGPRRRAVHDDGLAPRLTSREWQVLDLMRHGLTTVEIARRLVLTQATVRSHIASILRKLRVPDRESAIRLLEEV
jgi:DNA-binding NarL/FixJ family response regulator